MEVPPGKRPLVDNEQQSHILGLRNQEQIRGPDLYWTNERYG